MVEVSFAWLLSSFGPEFRSSVYLKIPEQVFVNPTLPFFFVTVLVLPKICLFYKKFRKVLRSRPRVHSSADSAIVATVRQSDNDR